jgi:thymidylate kinase
MTNGRFLALEGSDGAGKTTLARHLADLTYEQAAHLLIHESDADPDHCLVFVSRRQISATSPYSAALMDHIATMLWHSGDSPDLPDSFWVPLQTSWFTAHATTVVAPLLAAGFDVILDGWVYKFFSKLLLQGYHQPELDTVFSRVRMPDEVVLLTADAAILYDRRPDQFRPAELGMHAGYDDLGRDTFITYQTRGQQQLLAMAERHGWADLHVEAQETAADTLARLAPIVTELRRRETPSPVGGM